MKRFAFLAILCVLCAGVVLAQTSQNFGKQAVSGSTYVSGVVVSSTSDSLVIRDDAGHQQMLQINSATVNALNHPEGSRVKVSYHLNDSNQAIADEIQPGAAAETSSTSSSTAAEPPVASTAPSPSAMAQASPSPVTPAPAYSESTSSDTSSTTTARRTKLPKTASNLPAVALLGLAALGGALALRAAR